MKALSVEIRQRIVNAVKSGESMKRVAYIFQISYSSVKNYMKRAKNGSLEPQKSSGRPLVKFTPAISEAIKTWLKEKNDLTLEQIQRKMSENFQIEVSQSAIWRHLTANNITWKKKRHTRRSGNARTLLSVGKTGQPK